MSYAWWRNILNSSHNLAAGNLFYLLTRTLGPCQGEECYLHGKRSAMQLKHRSVRLCFLRPLLTGNQNSGREVFKWDVAMTQHLLLYFLNFIMFKRYKWLLALYSNNNTVHRLHWVKDSFNSETGNETIFVYDESFCDNGHFLFHVVRSESFLLPKMDNEVTP